MGNSCTMDGAYTKLLIGVNMNVDGYKSTYIYMSNSLAS